MGDTPKPPVLPRKDTSFYNVSCMWGHKAMYPSPDKLGGL